MTPQYKELRVEVDYHKHFSDGKTHWYPAIGWDKVEDAKTVFPNEKFRAVDPPLPLTQKLLDAMNESGYEGGN